MSTALRNTWVTPQSAQARRVYVMTPQGRGYVWDGVPLAEQIARDRIAVVLPGDGPAQYFSVEEVVIEGT
jgi:hypothetical protein